MMRIAQLTLLVRAYDEAIDWFERCLDFECVQDVDMGGAKRWVVVRPRGAAGAALVLAEARGDQIRTIGQQAGGRVFLFLEVEDFDHAYRRMLAEGVTFRETPREEAYGKVAVFEDLCGNPWDLIAPRRPEAA